jgi:hypothetical protein
MKPKKAAKKRKNCPIALGLCHAVNPAIHRENTKVRKIEGCCLLLFRRGIAITAGGGRRAGGQNLLFQLLDQRGILF